MTRSLHLRRQLEDASRAGGGPAFRRAIPRAHLAPAGAAASLVLSAGRLASGRSARRIGGRADIAVGAQNVHWEPKGAFTGELSLPLVTEAGATAALVGHSERRHLFGETDEQVGAEGRGRAEGRTHARWCASARPSPSGSRADRAGGGAPGGCGGGAARPRRTGSGSSSRTSRSGPSAPARTPPRTMPPRSTADPI